ncbi:MAG: PIN domain-containing protein [Chloroflexota bacterium]
MTSIFVDTAGWGNLFDQSELHHASASSIYREMRERNSKFITSNYVITELVSLLISPLRTPHPKIVTIIEELQASRYVETVHIDAALHDRSWRLFTARSDKLWSLVDCSSFAVMQELGLTEALTTDHHFEQAGFVRLLK